MSDIKFGSINSHSRLRLTTLAGMWRIDELVYLVLQWDPSQISEGIQSWWLEFVWEKNGGELSPFHHGGRGNVEEAISSQPGAGNSDHHSSGEDIYLFNGNDCGSCPWRMGTPNFVYLHGQFSLT
ncbi:Hypothetical predicted protein [Prunus dulcis]|uniref:Uncharacterized protein n=1 Tax=Prunus dulcis TaxID=3755 RepID=A0A5E4E6C1_PRUDU|nr:hypothetical protein L3X38_015117 [Prunus dulcis]VVA11334.1 Hypothetical predicted protein [Prunus dulcis]